MNITVNSTKAAWNKVNEIFPTDYEHNTTYSANAGYNIYTSTNPEYIGWISDLGSRLEINLADGNTIIIWIDEQPADNYDNGTKLAGELTRLDFCDILLATLAVAQEFEDNARNAADIETRRRELNNAAKWNKLHAKVKAQLENWDAAHGF